MSLKLTGLGTPSVSGSIEVPAQVKQFSGIWTGLDDANYDLRTTVEIEATYSDGKKEKTVRRVPPE